MEKDVKTRSSEQAQRANEAAHELLLQLKRAVQSSDDELVSHLLDELYARYEGMLTSLIRNGYSGYHRILLPEVQEIIYDTFLTIVDSIENYKENLLGIILIKAVCADLIGQQLRRKKRKEHPLEPDAQAIERINQILSDFSSVDTSLLIAEVERIIHEARLPDLEKSQTNDVKSSPTTPVADGVAPAPTEVETMGGIEGQPVSHPEVETKTGTEQQVEPAQTPLVEKPVSPLLGLHEELENVGAYDKLKNKKHRQVLEVYLSTNISQGDLMQMAGVNKANSINNIIHRSLQKVFDDLEPNIKDQYGGSANEAIKVKAQEQIKTDLSKKRIKKGVAGKEKTYTKPRGRPKGVVETQPRQYKEKTGRPKGRKDSYPRKASVTHEQQVSEPQKRIPQEQPIYQQRPPQEEHTIVDLTKSPQEQ